MLPFTSEITQKYIYVRTTQSIYV